MPGGALAAGEVALGATAVVSASAERLDGRLSLSLDSSQPLFDTQVYARAQGDKAPIGQVTRWEPGSEHEFDLDLPSPQDVPGDYTLLVEVGFRDQAGGAQSLALAFPYQVAGPGAEGPAAEELAGVSLDGDRIQWQLPEAGVSDVRLTLTTGPAWSSPGVLRPPATRIVLEDEGQVAAVPNWDYRQLARLEWVQDGRHFSRVSPWTLSTDTHGRWLAQSSPPSEPPWWSRLLWLGATAGLIAVALIPVLRQRLGKHSIGSLQPGPRGSEWVGALAVLVLTLWTVSHAAPGLWLTRTWSTGGDVASHVFYAKIFMDWLPAGKISGWLPESFAGFPAFTFYFPFPFTVAALLQYVVGPEVAFKLASMSPAFLLPAATYGLGWIWGWRVPTRLMAAAGATGFILSDATSIWGGNVLAQLAGEFSYSWGILLAVVFWGALAVALRNGGRWWLLAGVLEALVALSHGYALLVAGFGAFLYLLVSGDVRRHLRIILQVHVLAFLLIGFWLMPLMENLPWTIPNDSATAIENWQTLWPASLWPLALGWLPLALMLARPGGHWPYGIAFLTGICMLGLLGFVAGGRFGLADLRFFPYAQWALAVASAAALGWLFQQKVPSAALPLALVCLMALGAWWEPRMERIEGWSQWNLAGYEGKTTWPHYQATALTNAGPLEGPRLVFEHDPANTDLGSTRALEALPMFGSRPALEGLYMESATTGPFIYQLQAEISEQPSSPLNRFPSSTRSVDDAVGHLNELYVDRVILRSPRKQAQFAADPRFRLVARHGPLQTYELKELRTGLVDVVATPVVARGREDWLRHAFRRFLVDYPYAEREVYLAQGQSLPAPAGGAGTGRAALRSFSRERLVFETDSPGQPHLIRMTYHPRWSSTGGEPIFLVEPSFMLVYPRGPSVELVYGWGWGNWLGTALSASGLILLASGGLPRSPLNPPVVAAVLTVHRRRFSGFLLAASLLILAGWWMDPERVYQRGHLRYNAGDQPGAAALFDQAFGDRRGPAQRSEALFWAARSLQLAGELEDAGGRYARLTSEFPESYWYPESMFRLIEIHLQRGERGAAAALHAGLAEAVPDNDWTRKAGMAVNDSAVQQ
jgi:hypothetical protein